VCGAFPPSYRIYSLARAEPHCARSAHSSPSVWGYGSIRRRFLVQSTFLKPQAGPEELFRRYEGYHIVSFAFDETDESRWWSFDSKSLVAHVHTDLQRYGEGAWGAVEAEHVAMLARKRFPKIENPAMKVNSGESVPRRYLTRADINRLWKHEQMRRFIKCGISDGTLTAIGCAAAAASIEIQAAQYNSTINSIVANADVDSEIELFGRAVNRLSLVGQGGAFRKLLIESPSNWTFGLSMAQITQLLTCAGVTVLVLDMMKTLEL
jgi:hypothetical protein